MPPYQTSWLIQNRQNSMYTLLHNGGVDKDTTGKLEQIFDQEWSTGPLLFEK